MKKSTFLILFVLFIANSFSYAQGVVQFRKSQQKLINFNKNSATVSKAIKGIAPVWEVTFDEAVPSWTFAHSDSTSKDWIIGEESSRPCYWGPINADNTGWHVYSMDYLYEQLELTTTPGSYAYIDIVGDRSDLYEFDLPDGCTMNGAGQNPFDAWILFEDIDMSEVDVPYIVYYNSYHESNSFFFDCFLEYSLDDGNTWTSIEVNKDSDSEDGWHYGEYSLGLPACANQGNVDIRFRHVSDAAFTTEFFELYPSSWAWIIDDVRLYDYTDFGIEYDLVVKDTRINFFDYIDYNDPEFADYNVFHYSSYYGQAPNDQYKNENGLLWFNISLENNGTETVTPKVNVKVTNPYNTVVFDEVVEGVVTAFTGADTLDMIEVDCALPIDPNTLQVPIGRYEVTFNAYVEGHEDEDYYPTDNVDTAYFYVSDNVFSREADDITGNMTAKYLSDGGTDGDGIGTSFTLYYETFVKSVEVFIDQKSTVGTTINAEINEFDSDNSEWCSVLTSTQLTIAEEHLGQWVNIEFDDTYNVEFGERNYKELLVGIICYYGGGEIYIGESTANNHSAYSTSWKFAGGEGTWRSISNYAGGPAIRLYYGDGWCNPFPIPLPENSSITNSQEIMIYPNPSTGILNLTGVEGANVEILNMMGQTVVSIENANDFNQIDMSSYSNGTYFVKVVVDNNVVTKKINLMK